MSYPTGKERAYGEAEEMDEEVALGPGVYDVRNGATYEEITADSAVDALDKFYTKCPDAFDVEIEGWSPSK